MEQKKIKEVKKAFEKLGGRIIKHRMNCKGWNRGKPCFECHNHALTRIENAIKELI